MDSFCTLLNRPGARVHLALLVALFGLAIALVLAQPAQAAGTFNVTDYGATANDTTDDRPAIQSCIDAAAQAHAEVYIPAGSYRLTPNGSNHGLELPSNVTVRGDGDASLLTMIGGTDWTRMVYASGKSGIVVRDLKLDVNAADAVISGTGEQRHGIFFTNCANCTVQRVTITQPLGDGVFLYGSSSYCIVDSCTVIAGTTNNPRVAINVQGANYATVQGCDVRDFDVAYKAELDDGDAPSVGNKIINNRCSGVSSLCLGLNGRTSGRVVDYLIEGNYLSGGGEWNTWLSRTDGCVLRNNTLRGGGTGVHAVFDNQRVVLDNNVFDSQTYTGVAILNYLGYGASDDVRILSNTFASDNYTQGTVSIWTSQATNVEVGSNAYPSQETLVNNVGGAPDPYIHDNVPYDGSVPTTSTTSTTLVSTTTTTEAPTTTTVAPTTTTSPTTTTTTTTLPPVTTTTTTTSSTTTTAAPTTTTTEAPAPTTVPTATTRYEQNDPRLQYAGSWSTYSHSAYSGGSYSYTRTAGSSLTVPFSGTAIDYIACLSRTQGRAQITLDGVSQGSVNLYSSGTKRQQKVWGISGLSPGPHTLVITCSTSRYINADAFDVTGTLAASSTTPTTVAPTTTTTAASTTTTVAPTTTTTAPATTTTIAPTTTTTVSSWFSWWRWWF